MTTTELRQRLRLRCQWPDWALYEEFSLGAGRDGRPSYTIADAVALGMTGRTHGQVHGFEVKASRPDWVREMRTIGKADDVLQFCHRWWLVAPADVARADELPGTWGWLVPHGRSLRVARQAPLLLPRELGPGQVRALVWAAVEKLNRNADVAARLVEEYERGKRDALLDRRIAGDESAAERLAREVADFEEASGVKIGGWAGGRELGQQVRFLTDGGLRAQKEQLRYTAEAVLDALVALSAVVPSLPAKSYPRRGSVDLRRLLADARQSVESP